LILFSGNVPKIHVYNVTRKEYVKVISRYCALGSHADTLS
jgi:polycomb protein EED